MTAENTAATRPRASATAGSVSRIDRRFAALAREGRAGLVTFVTAGDPTPEISEQIVLGLPEAGADVIELGMPFTDPMADGPAIQAAGLRALDAGITMGRTLDMVRRLRERDTDTPVILMGYYNPIHHYGVDRFLTDAREAGVDGLIIVDLPPEEDDELAIPAANADIAFVRLVAPTTSDARMPKVVKTAQGFIYCVSITGITGSKSASMDLVSDTVARIRRRTDLPVAIGFGIKTPEQAAEFAQRGDGVVVGSAIVEKVAAACERGAPAEAVADVHACVRALAEGVRRTKRDA